MNTSPVAIVTGAGSGIGRAVALQLGSLNYRLALVGRTESKLRETASLISKSYNASPEKIIISIDVSKDGAADKVVDEVKNKLGRIDALINNAGMAPLLPIKETTKTIIEETFSVNTFAPAQFIACVWHVFEEQSKLEDHPSPCVINVSTIGTADPFPGFFLYAASKCAIESFVRSIAVEGEKENVRAFVIAPGAVETPLLRSLFDETMISKDQTLHPDEVAELIIECIRGKRDNQNGTTIYLTPENA